MSAVYDLTSEEEPFRPAEPKPPQVFTRLFSVPAGAPWEQSRAAQLEARHGSPLPIAELMWRLRRLGGWRLGQPARYAAFYVRSREYSAPFETVVDVEGVPMQIAFGLAGDQFKRARRLAVVGAVVAACVVPVAIGSVAALHARSAAEDQLDHLERSIAAKSKLVARVQVERRQARELQAAVGRATRAQDVLDDLAWVTAAKTPDARILALHWDHGLLAIEARGDATPIQAIDRQIDRASKPVRAGVWLWGVRAADGTGLGNRAP
jgi:hypothetical protein